MQRAMATEAEAGREARAKVVAAEGEQKASLALKEAAGMLYIGLLNLIVDLKSISFYFEI